jgi:hypothetical protein
MEEKIANLVNEVFDNFKDYDRLMLHRKIKELIDSKYSNLNDRHKKILEDSDRDSIPVFMFTAKDKCSMSALNIYEGVCKEQGCSEEFLWELECVLEDYGDWVDEHPEKIKLPD